MGVLGKMKNLFQERPSPDSTSTNLSGDEVDQEMGSCTTSSNEDIKMKNSVRCFLRGMDLNPMRALLAEMLGTFVLMFCVCGIIASTQLSGDGAGLLEYAVTAGLSIVVLIFCIGPISGAHVNPAVTLAFAAVGHFQWSRVPLYVLAQTLGSVLATYVGESVYGIKSELMATQPIRGCIAAFWVELIATFLIMFLAAALAHQSKFVGPLSGLIIGLAIGLAVLISGPVSGGSFNPARSLGPAFVSRNFNGIWIYLTAPVIGALLGAFLYRFLHLQGPTCSSNSSPSTTLRSHSLAFVGN